MAAVAATWPNPLRGLQSQHNAGLCKPPCCHGACETCASRADARTRRASPSLRIISVDVGWPAGAVAPGPRGPHIVVLRRARPCARSARAAHAHRAACTLRAHARAHRTFTRVGGAAQLRWSRRRFELIAKKQKRVSETETESPPDRRRPDAVNGLRQAAQERHRWGSAPTPRSVLLVGRRPTLTATGRSALRADTLAAARRTGHATRSARRSATPAKPLLLDAQAQVREKVHQGIFEDYQKSCRRNLPPPARAASRPRTVGGGESRRVRVFSAITIPVSARS